MNSTSAKRSQPAHLLKVQVLFRPFTEEDWPGLLCKDLTLKKVNPDGCLHLPCDSFIKTSDFPSLKPCTRYAWSELEGLPVIGNNDTECDVI